MWPIDSKTIPGYEVLNVTCAKPRDMAREKDYAMTALHIYGEGKTEKEREQLWEVLTSRGDDKLIYGPMPKG